MATASSSYAPGNIAPSVISTAVFAELKALNVLLPFQQTAVEFAIRRRVPPPSTHLSVFRQAKGFILSDEMGAHIRVLLCV